ncbi:MAG: hypothetical protein JNM24_02320 [Bdellovibrionaceae bacterium]|nr:hypothetical protein [Pseudobdellovibrionaceae bacterium]
MFMLIDVIVSKKSVNAEKGTTAYQCYFNNAKKLIGEDGKETILPETSKLKFDQPLAKGWHLLQVRVSQFQNQTFYTGLKEIKDPKLVEALVKEI